MDIKCEFCLFCSVKPHPLVEEKCKGWEAAERAAKDSRECFRFPSKLIMDNGNTYVINDPVNKDGFCGEFLDRSGQKPDWIKFYKR